MGNIRAVIDAHVFIAIFLLVVGLLLIPLSLIPTIERSYIAQPATQQITGGACPPQISIPLDNGSYRINLSGPFIIGPTTRIEVRDNVGNTVYEASIDAQKSDKQFDFSITNPATYTILIENGEARVELLRLVGQTAWSESVTHPSQPLMIIGIAVSIMGTAILQPRTLFNCLKTLVVRLRKRTRD